MRLQDIKPGDTVMIDGGFPCVKAGPAIVQQDPYGTLFIACEVGRHSLEAQEDEDGELIGISKAAE